ncbi:MAG: hypothetical protein HXY49_11365 [Ignavibacteriaceae bacterium]|nr:hypothetical protein [Ignavibacteriaceae bacterium]
MIEAGYGNFPRELTGVEKHLLSLVLPANKPGYLLYRDLINDLMVIGYGRFGNGNKILGKENSVIDLQIPTSPVFAVGNYYYDDQSIDVIIHQFNNDQIEFDLGIDDLSFITDLNKLKGWNFSEWIPGQKLPADDKKVRELIILPDEKVLAFSVTFKKIWLYDFSSGVNTILPVTNFFNEVMRVKNIRDAKIALKPGSFFERLDTFTDLELASALLSYSKYLHSIKIDEKRIRNFFETGSSKN